MKNLNEYEIHKIITKDLESRNDIVYIYDNRHYTFSRELNDFNTVYIINHTENKTIKTDNFIYHYSIINDIKDYSLYLHMCYAMEYIPLPDYYKKYIKSFTYILDEYDTYSVMTDVYNSIKTKKNYPLYYTKMMLLLHYISDSDTFKFDKLRFFELEKINDSLNFQYVMNKYKIYNNYKNKILNSYYYSLLEVRNDFCWFENFMKDCEPFIQKYNL